MAHYIVCYVDVDGVSKIINAGVDKEHARQVLKRQRELSREALGIRSSIHEFWALDGDDPRLRPYFDHPSAGYCDEYRWCIRESKTIETPYQCICGESVLTATPEPIWT